MVGVGGKGKERKGGLTTGRNEMWMAERKKG